MFPSQAGPAPAAGQPGGFIFYLFYQDKKKGGGVRDLRASQSSQGEPGPTGSLLGSALSTGWAPAETEHSSLACVQWVEPESPRPPEGGR